MKNATIQAVYGSTPDSEIFAELCRIVLGREVSFIDKHPSIRQAASGNEGNLSAQETSESPIGLQVAESPAEQELQSRVL